MGDENIRKRDPAENRRERAGYPEDGAKTGGEESNVGLTNSTVGRTGAGSGGAIGGSDDFLSGETGSSAPGEFGPDETSIGDETRQVLAGDQEGDSNFGGRTGSGKSFIASNKSRDDLGAAGAGQPAAKDSDAKKG